MKMISLCVPRKTATEGVTLRYPARSSGDYLFLVPCRISCVEAGHFPSHGVWCEVQNDEGLRDGIHVRGL